MAIVGSIKSFNQKRHVSATTVRPITDMNEVHYHFLECVYVSLSARNPGMVSKRMSLSTSEIESVFLPYSKLLAEAPLRMEEQATRTHLAPASSKPGTTDGPSLVRSQRVSWRLSVLKARRMMRVCMSRRLPGVLEAQGMK